MQSDQCISCARYELGGTCEAFPDGIPDEIITGEFDHTQPHAGDHGLRWTPLQVEVSASAATPDGVREAVTAAAVEPGVRWRSVLVLEGVETDDGRLIDPGALDWRDLPLTMMGLTETGPGGHEGAQVAGRIDTITREGDEVIGEGVFDAGEFGSEIARMVEDQVLRGVSVDLAIREFELRDRETGATVDEEAAFDPDQQLIFAVTDASIMGATICPFPAFRDANITITADGDQRYATFETTPDITILPETLQLEPGEEGEARGGLVATLRTIFSDALTMASTAQGYSFSVQGSAFSEAAGLFTAISKDLAGSLHAYAGQISAFGGEPPQGLNEALSLRTFEDGAPAVATFDMNVTLRQQNEKMLAALNAAYVSAVAAEEAGLVSVLQERIQRHQMWAQQLRVAIAA